MCLFKVNLSNKTFKLLLKFITLVYPFTFHTFNDIFTRKGMLVYISFPQFLLVSKYNGSYKVPLNIDWFLKR